PRRGRSGDRTPEPSGARRGQRGGVAHLIGAPRTRILTARHRRFLPLGTMSALYWFALVVGAGLLGLSLFGDTDAGGDVDVDAAGGGADGFRILSTRNLTYFLFGFGATGVLLGLVWED